MADIEAIAQEITDDPLGRDYASMTDQQVADDLNAEQRTVYVDVSVSTLAGTVEMEGIYEKLQGASTDEAAKLLRIASNQSPITALVYGNPTRRTQIDGMLDQLVSDDVITSDDAGKLRQLGNKQISRSQELGLLGSSPEIGPAHVEKARNL